MSLSSFFRAIVFCAFLAAGVLRGQDLAISSGSTTGITTSTSGSTVTYTASSTGSPVLNVNSIINELNAGKNVKVVGIRSITISSSINVSPSSAVTFTLESQGTTTPAAILFGSGLQLKTTGAAVSVAIMMKTVDKGYSAYADLSNLDVNTGGGAFTVQGLDSYAANAALSLGGATINAGAGDITMTAQSYYTNTEATVYGVRIAGASNITTTTGNITITGNMLGAASNTSASSRPLLVEGTSTIRSTGSGSVTLKGEVPNTNSPSVDPTYVLELSTTGTISSGGTMTITGNNLGSTSTVIGVAIRKAITSVGNLVINSTDVYVAEDITTTGSGSSIAINSKNNFSTDNASRQTISTNNGNISVIADDNADGSGVLDLDYLILAPGTGNIIIRGSTFNWTTNNSTDKPYLNGTGNITLEPSSASFGQEPYTTWFAFDEDGNGMSGLTIGKSGNTTNITHSGTAILVAGPINLYGGNITINQNLTSSTSGSDMLIYASADIVLSTGRTITTNAGDVILWANSDGGTSNGGVFLDAASSITTSGGHVWIGGSSTNGGSTTWNGLTVGNGYAVSGRDLTPFQNEGTAIDWDAGVLLDETNINSGGGNIYIAGKRSVSPNNRGGAGIINYSGTSGTLINSGTGTITMLGETSVDVAGSDLGIMTGLHPTNYTGKLTIQSANTSNATAISITASTVTADAGLLVEDHTRILSTATSGGGGISMTLSSGTGSALQVGIGGNSGTLDLLSASGAIAVDGGSDAITVPVTVGTFKIGSISGDANVPSSTANVTLTSNTISLAGSVPIVTTGTLTIRPTAGSPFSSTFSTSVLNYTGITGLTIGHTANTAAVTVGSTTSIAGPITIYGGDVFAQQNITSTASGAAILLQATGYIDVSASRTIQTNNGNITLRANSAGTAVVLPNSTTGAITLNSGSSLLSNGGNITLGGNFNGTEGTGLYAASNRSGGSPGILINNATLTAAGGNINIYGKCASSYDDGIRLQATITTTGSGNIGLYGDAFGGYNNTQYFGGITFFNEVSTVEAVNGNVTLDGVLTNSQSTEGYAINFYRSPGSSGQTKHIQILSRTGNIQITADRGSSIGGGIGHSSWGHVYFGSPSNNSYTATGSITFTYSGLVNAGSNGFKVKTTGAVTYEPVSTSFDAAQTFPPTANYVLADGASGLTIGKSGNTANITLGSATTINGNVNIYGGTVAINGALTATDKSVVIQASVKLTQSAAITAAKLGLLGSGYMILDNISNNVGTFAAGTPTARVGRVKLVNNNSVIIGTVNPTGIYSSGEVMIVTRDGDNVNINAPINTTSTSGNAVRVYADIGKAAGASTGGQIMVNGGTITMGTGGIAKLFSGNETSSYGLNNLTGGSSFLRYSVATDSTIANGSFSPVISSAGTYAIYRDASYSLTNLTVGSGTLAPTFSASVFNYTVTLSTAPGSFSFTPTVSSGGTIYISENNGSTYTAHSSGTAYTDNTINSVTNKYIIQVRDGAGTTTKTTYVLQLLINQASIPSAPSTDWRDLFKGAFFDPNDDQQATSETDLVGNGTYPMMQSQQRTVSVSGTIETVYYFRVRLGNTGTPKTSAYFGLDVNKDLKIDMVVEANLKATTPYVSYHKSDPAKDGSSPALTAWLNSTSNTAIEQKLTSAKSMITNYAVATAVLDLDNASLTGNTGQNTGDDTWLEFAFTESSFSTFTLNALGSQKSGSDVNGIVYFTSTSQTANGDIGGINDKTANLNSTWSQLGIILTSSLNSSTSSETDPPTVRVQSTKSLNGSGTIYGAWNGNLYNSPSLTVTIGNNTYYYNVSGQTNNITIDPSGLTWSLTVSGYSPGLYTVNANINDGAGRTGSGNGTLLISDVLVNDSITFDVTPKITGSSSVGSGITVNVKIYDPANMTTPVNTGTTTTGAGGSWNYTVPSALTVKEYTVIVDLTTGSSTATDTGDLTILDYIYPTIAINPGSLTNNGGSCTITGTSNHHLYGGTKTMTITMEGPGGPHSGTVSIAANGNWSITFSTLQAGSVYTIDANLNFVTSGLEANDFGSFTTPTPLPVTYLYFSGSCHKQNVTLRWGTAMEENMDKFEIQQFNADGKWATVAEVKATGLSFEPRHYSTTLKQNPTARLYRIRSTEFGGVVKNTPAIEVLCGHKEPYTFKVYPNPSQGSFTIESENAGTYRIMDAAGRLVQSGDISGKRIVSGILPGVYVVSILTENESYTQKVVVE